MSHSSQPVDVDQVAAEFAQVTGRLVRVLRRRAPMGLGPGSMAALATLVRCGPMRLGDLAVREGVAPPTLTRMIGSLEEAGHVERRPDEADRRAVLVSVTESGRRAVAAVQAERAKLLVERLAALSPEQLAAVVAALPALREMAGEEPQPPA